MRPGRRHHRLNSEHGFTLVESLVGLAILGLTAAAFLGGLGTTLHAGGINDARSTAESLATAQLEQLRQTPYSYNATSYSAADTPASTDYAGFTVNISATPLNTPDDGVQRLTIGVYRNGAEVYTVTHYKVDR